MKAPVPLNEAARLEALRQYRILDTTREQAFDDLTLIAAHVAGVPLAGISLIDSDRQWYKATYGWEVVEVPRDYSFCAHTIAQNEPLVVPDATADPRFAGHPLVTEEPHIRFYAGVPLTTVQGHTLGTLCVYDHQPRELTQAQRACLLAIARLTMLQLEMRRNAAHLTAVSERLAAELAEAKGGK